MKKITTLFFIATLLLVSCNSNKTKNTDKNLTDLGKDRIEILDFYGKHRCTSCVNIENHTKKVLDNYYKKEQESKQVVFKLIQWDIPENEAITDKFMAAGTSLFIYRIKDGKEYVSDISDFAFKKSADAVAFEKGFRERLDAELKKQ